MNKGGWSAPWGVFSIVMLLAGVFAAFWMLVAGPKGPKAADVDRAEASALARESKSLLKPTLKNVYFGMTQPELQAARPRARRQPKADEPRFFMFDETLSANERVLYGVDNTNLRLVKVQIAGRLGSVSEVPLRIALMQSRYGSPRGIWDCPVLPGQLPTRRFIYQRSALGVMDSFLLVGEQIAVTLYVASMPILEQSLAMARCSPTAKDAITRFPAVPLGQK